MIMKTGKITAKLRDAVTAGDISVGPHQSKSDGEGRSQSRRTGKHRGYGRGGRRAGNRGRAKKAPAVDSDKSAAE